ncbi:MAG: AsmA-like C-terminal domain-containing protein, partial [Rhodospirillaceae bacterium]
GGDFQSRYVLEPVVNNEQRPTIGLGVVPFTPPYLDGPVPAHVVYTVNRDDTSHLKAKVYLTEPKMAIPQLGWFKEPGVEANADVEASFINGRLDQVSSFKVWSEGDLAVSGAAHFNAEGQLATLTIDPSVAGETRLAGTLSRDEQNGYVIEMAGEAFNSSYFWKEFGRDDGRAETAEEEAGEATPLTLRADIDRMWLTPETMFRDVSLDFESDASGIHTIDFESRVDGEKHFSFKLTSTDEGRIFHGMSEDGGSVVRAVGLFGDIVGGELSISGEMAPDGTALGVAEIRDFKLVDAPLVARLLSVAALTGILDELRGEGISFATLRVPFSYADSKLTIEDGEMFGNSLGLTGEGNYDFASSSMNFNGTLIPAYAINSALNSIPLLGDLLTGGNERGGIFAATYAYRGDVATAQPTVNPLAALAPGFLRHIFDVFNSRPQEASSIPPGERNESGADEDD